MGDCEALLAEINAAHPAAEEHRRLLSTLPPRLRQHMIDTRTLPPAAVPGTPNPYKVVGR